MGESSACSVCGEPVDQSDSAVCNSCERRFHLRLRNDAEGKDCGDVWINEHYLSLEFACFECLGIAAVPDDAAAEPPVGSGH